MILLDEGEIQKLKSPTIKYSKPELFNYQLPVETCCNPTFVCSLGHDLWFCVLPVCGNIYM